MQLFECPFCGRRNETEFHFLVETGKPRPEPSSEVSAERWSNYLHLQEALEDEVAEIWVHRTCGEFLILKRNTRTREIIGSEPLPGREA